jgi:hypothetical protein
MPVFCSCYSNKNRYRVISCVAEDIATMGGNQISDLWHLNNLAFVRRLAAIGVRGWGGTVGGGLRLAGSYSVQWLPPGQLG